MVGIRAERSSLSSAPLFLGVLLCMVLGHRVDAWDDDENQFWLEGSVQKSLAEAYSFRLTQQARWRGGGHFYNHTELCALYDINKAWTAAIAYRFIDKERRNHQWKPDHLFHVNLINTSPVWEACLKSRLRIAYTDRYGDADDTPDVRPRFDLFPKRKFTALKLSPYVASETFYDLEEDILYRSRLLAGLKASPKRFGLDLYIMHERAQSPQQPWTETYIIGLAARIKF